jgi:predicted membrane metal-binding protein
MALQGKNAKILTIVAIVAAVLQLISLISSYSTGTLVSLAISAAIIALLLQPPSKAWFKSRGAPSF